MPIATRHHLRSANLTACRNCCAKGSDRLHFWMSNWTLGLVKAHGMALEAHCPNEACRRFHTFDLDMLIAETGAGAEFEIADIPPLDCKTCGARLEIRLAMIPPRDPNDAVH